MVEYMLTTFDNPFDPFTQFDDWFSYDESKGYHTCSYLARIAKVSNALPESMNLKEINRAMDSIIDLNGSLYKKVKKDDINNGWERFKND